MSLASEYRFEPATSVAAVGRRVGYDSAAAINRSG
ncbi:hypothetical protein B0I08_10785 [Glaciihabitans tibetensis]|uniref:Uncharacterized protein n=1 Tax=Glaciihabitans tibetensis TaxID=1266600 RepID=A0A2T0VAL0_9MICO|nr:hypothetical protein B0I08_10785 [Glaciihabitans tibetensis]